MPSRAGEGRTHKLTESLLELGNVRLDQAIDKVGLLNVGADPGELGAEGSGEALGNARDLADHNAHPLAPRGSDGANSGNGGRRHCGLPRARNAWDLRIREKQAIK